MTVLSCGTAGSEDHNRATFVSARLRSDATYFVQDQQQSTKLFTGRVLLAAKIPKDQRLGASEARELLFFYFLQLKYKPSSRFLQQKKMFKRRSALETHHDPARAFRDPVERVNVHQDVIGLHPLRLVQLSGARGAAGGGVSSACTRIVASGSIVS